MRSENSLYRATVLNLSPNNNIHAADRKLGQVQRLLSGFYCSTLFLAPFLHLLLHSNLFFFQSELAVPTYPPPLGAYAPRSPALPRHHLVLDRRAELSGRQEKRKFVRNLRKFQLLLRAAESLANKRGYEPV